MLVRLWSRTDGFTACWMTGLQHVVIREDALKRMQEEFELYRAGKVWSQYRLVEVRPQVGQVQRIRHLTFRSA